MGKLTISMAIFNSYVNVYQRVILGHRLEGKAWKSINGKNQWSRVKCALNQPNELQVSYGDSRRRVSGMIVDHVFFLFMTWCIESDMELDQPISVWNIFEGSIWEAHRNAWLWQIVTDPHFLAFHVKLFRFCPSRDTSRRVGHVFCALVFTFDLLCRTRRQRKRSTQSQARLLRPRVSGCRMESTTKMEV